MGRLNQEQRCQRLRELTSAMIRKHYCENDSEFLIEQMAEDIIWIGAGEQESASGVENVAKIFRQFVGMVPKCIITEEEYQVQEIAPGAYLCSGKAWIVTDPSTKIFLRVHQRISLIFRWLEDSPKCTHIHISNPYQDMAAEDIGFPTKIGYQSYQYLQEQIQEQTKKLQRMIYQDMLTGVYNRNKFVTALEEERTSDLKQLGIAYFDLNGLKKVNDEFGHSAGDALICSMAAHLWSAFENKVYRTGGDEFAVIERELSEEEFRKKIAAVKKEMKEEGISFAAGISWRHSNGNIKEQFEEADQSMYEEKRIFYKQRNSGMTK